MSVSSESEESNETTSTESNRAEKEEQKEPVLDFRRAEGASLEGAEEPRPLASSSTEAANASLGAAVNGEVSAQGGVNVADPSPEGMDLQVPFDTTDPILANLVESQARARSMDAEAWGDREFFLDGKAWRDGAFSPEDTPNPSTPHWSRW